MDNMDNMDNYEGFSFIKISNREAPIKEDQALVDFSMNIGASKRVLDMLNTNISPMTLGITKDATLHMYFAQHILSAINTLGNIEHCAVNWNFSDSFTLARKYRDVLFQCLFIINTILSYEEHCEKLTTSGHPFASDSITSEDIDSLTQFFDFLTSESSRRPEDNAIILFLENFISVSEKSMIDISRQFFDAQEYKKILEDSDSTLKGCFDSFFKDIWKNTNRILNNYVHANGISYITSNLKQYIFSDRNKLLSELSLVIMNTTTMFFSIMILIDPTCISASDYIDSFEGGMIPEEGSQYFVAPGFQEFIDKYVVEISPELKKYLQEKNKYGMKI